MTVTEFKSKEGYRFPEIFLDCLPDTCLDPRCGSPAEMNETLTGLHCSNPRCPTKIANRMVAMLNSIGVKDMGVARANAFISKYGIRNPLIIFAYEPDSDGAMGEGISLETSKKIVDQITKKKSFTLWEYVRSAGLPFIQTSAMHIFSDYDSLEEAYKPIEEDGVEYIRQKLNIKKGGTDELDLEPQDISIRAIKVYESLMTFKQDLFEALPYVNIIETHREGMKTLKAVCSEEVGDPYKTKADFYATVNNLYGNLHVDFLSSVTKSIDYLVWAGADGNPRSRLTNKVKKVRDYNEKYETNKSLGKLKPGDHYIPIVTAKQFLGILQDLAKGEE